MRSKFISVVAICFLLNSPLQAASAFCPYHWWLAIVAVGEMAAANLPAHRREVRVVQGVAFVGTLAFLAKKIIERRAAEVDDSDQLVEMK